MKCCSRDHNEDGNCDIHSAPGVYRNTQFNQRLLNQRLLRTLIYEFVLLVVVFLISFVSLIAKAVQGDVLWSLVLIVCVVFLAHRILNNARMIDLLKK